MLVVVVVVVVVATVVGRVPHSWGLSPCPRALGNAAGAAGAGWEDYKWPPNSAMPGGG